MSTNNKGNNMSTNETYDRIRSKNTEDKILQQYNETRMKLISEGYKTTDQIDQESKVLHKYEVHPVSRIQAVDYAMNRKRFTNNLTYEDKQVLDSARHTFVSVVSFAVIFIIFLAYIG